MSKTRGIVIANGEPVIARGRICLTAYGLERLNESLRMYALYWDRIEYPQNHMISFGTTEDVAELERLGVLSQTFVKPPGGDMTRGVALTQLEAFSRREKEQPGQWSMTRSDWGMCLPPGESVEVRKLLVELHESLPVPGSEVPIGDVVGYREKHQAELAAFRAEMDAIYQTILNSGDPLHAKIANVERVKRALADLDASTKEKFVHRKVVHNLSIDVNIKDSALAGSTTAGAALMLGAPSFAAAIAGGVSAVASNFRFSLQLAPAPTLAPTTRAFAYAYDSMKELK